MMKLRGLLVKMANSWQPPSKSLFYIVPGYKNEKCQTAALEFLSKIASYEAVWYLPLYFTGYGHYCITGFAFCYI